MTYGSSDPNAQPDVAGQGAEDGLPPQSQAPQPEGTMPPQPFPQPQQPWAGAAFPGAPRPSGPATGPGMAVVAMVLGLFGAVVWLLPWDLEPFRHYLPFPFALGGLVLGVIGLVGNRRGKPMAAIGVIFSVIGLLLGFFMVGLEIMHG